MAFDAEQFLADVLKNVPEDKKQVVEEALGMEAVSKELESGYSRQSDYSRKMDELRSARDQAQQEIVHQQGAVDAERSRYVDWYEGANKDYTAAMEKLNAYKDEYGDLEAGEGKEPTVASLPSNALTREEHSQILAEQFDRHDRQAIQFADILTDLKLEHNQRFTEKLDTAKLFDHVQKSGLPIQAAYQDLISDRVQKAQDEKIQEQIKQAREEGMMEGRSQAQLPVRPDSSSPRPLDGLDKESTSEDRVNAAASAWRQAQLAR